MSWLRRSATRCGSPGTGASGSSSSGAAAASSG
uniref:Uncharacterized protein n=1 Tax=Arundo donax TaxID=35708 RepID=A0A0A9CHY4_ARUDO